MKYANLLLLILLITSGACKNEPSKSEESSSSTNLKDIELLDALELMNQKDIITIDIRTPEEIALGKILTSALEMDYYADDFKSKLEEMDREAHYVVYCRSGGRSGKTLTMMKEMGFKNAYNVLGGYNAYKELNE